jgi:hypothetical protein
MILRMLGASHLVQLMATPAVERPPADCSWLLHGPTDEAAVEPEQAEDPDTAAPMRWAAE